MWEWIVSVGAVVIASTLITLIVPDNRLTGIISVVLAVTVISVIVKPLKSFDFNTDFSFNYNENGVEIDYSYAEHVNFLRCENLKKNCIDALNKKGYDCLRVDISYDERDFRQLIIKNVKLFFSKEVINSSFEHIDNIDEVRKLVSSLIGVDEGVIDVIIES